MLSLLPAPFTGAEMVLGVNHHDTLMFANSLGPALRSQGKPAGAEALRWHTVTGKRRPKGVRLHPALPMRLPPEVIYDVANSPLEPVVPPASGDVIIVLGQKLSANSLLQHKVTVFTPLENHTTHII